MNQDQNKLEEFKELRLSIANRIEEIEEFFDDNFYNEFIFYFERGKYILKKLLMYEPNLLDEIDSGKNVKALILGQKSHISRSTPDIFVDPETEMTKFSNNYFMNKNKSYQIFSDNNILQTKNNIYNNKTNASNNTYKKQKIKNNFNKNIIKTSNNNTNSKTNFNKSYLMNYSKSNLSYNNYLNENKKIMNKNNSNNYYNYNKIKNNDFKNKYYNGYYNKATRNKYLNTNSDEDSEEKRENKVKYLDWTENNTIQNTNSNQMNSVNTYYNINNNENNISNKSNNSFKKNKNNKNKIKNKRDMIINNEIEYDKYNDLIPNKNNNKANNNIYLNKAKKNISKYKIEDKEKEDDPNVFKINFFDSNEKEKSLSEISSNRRGENEDSLISNNSLNKEQYKEILFQIKLTKEEYHLLLREKAKNINPLK